MTKGEKQALLKIMQDMKEVKANVDYLVEAVELLVQIQTEQVKNQKGRRY
jgi:hypothetical protein